MEKFYTYIDHDVHLIVNLSGAGCEMSYKILSPNAAIGEGIVWSNMSTVIQHERLGLIYAEELANAKIKELQSV